MSSKMKVLIAYDGINPVKGIVRGLQQAGLPKSVEAVVFTVVDALVPPAAGSFDMGADFSAEYTDALRASVHARVQNDLDKARGAARRAADHLQAAFPGWTLHAEAAADSPAWAIIKKSEKWKADLIVVESHHKPRLAKIFFGSVAQKVVTEASCPVRVIHEAPEETKTPVRLVIAVDGSSDSELAVNAAASRHWKKGSSARLVTVVDARLASASSSDAGAPRWMKKNDRKAREWIVRMSGAFEKKLKASGLTVTTLVKEGDPSHVLVDEAKKWGADCVFIGARGLNLIERFLLGSVSASVAAGASCAVEVVRAGRASKKR